MSPPAGKFADLRRPRGLAARAVMFTTLMVVVTATVSAAIVLAGAHREGDRLELSIARDLTEHLAERSASRLTNGEVDILQHMIQGATSRAEVRAIAIRDANGATLAQAGGSAADDPVMDALTQRILQHGEGVVHARGPEGSLAVAAPMVDDGQVIGVVLRLWENRAYRFDVLPALAPFLLILGCLVLAAIPLTARLVRRAVAPLDQLSRYAEQVAEHGEAKPISIRTGDEFETLANAFNNMTGRLDASMRQIQEIAFVDPVTRLPNQERFIREVDFFILRGKGEDGGVALFELQRLPKLLQTLDPDAARDLQRAVAERFKLAARMVDRAVGGRQANEQGAAAARLGLSEFAVFAPNLASPSDAARFAQHLNIALNRPFEWRGHKLTLGACCGVALAPRDGKDADTVIRHARMALGAAQQAPAYIKVFTPSLDREAMARLMLEREMRGALERNEFRAYFQPKVNIATGRIEACEALARWVRPDRTIISPGRFIPVAEESGLIGPLSDAILREACWKAASWKRAGHAAKVAVNVSALQFRSERFADNVLRVVQHAGLPPESLELEITETVALEDPERALRVIQPLREAGVRFAIDDFGCGHSSLAVLSKLPFDVIKIDQQFIRALERGDSQAGAIVEMILALGRTLDMEVVAEGVERREDMDFMAERGCRWVQGFLFGAAVSAAEFAELLRRQAGEEVEATDAA